MQKSMGIIVEKLRFIQYYYYKAINLSGSENNTKSIFK